MQPLSPERSLSVYNENKVNSPKNDKRVEDLFSSTVLPPAKKACIDAIGPTERLELLTKEALALGFTKNDIAALQEKKYLPSAVIYVKNPQRIGLVQKLSDPLTKHNLLASYITSILIDKLLPLQANELLPNDFQLWKQAHELGYSTPRILDAFQNDQIDTLLGVGAALLNTEFQALTPWMSDITIADIEHFLSFHQKPSFKLLDELLRQQNNFPMDHLAVFTDLANEKVKKATKPAAEFDELFLEFYKLWQFGFNEEQLKTCVGSSHLILEAIEATCDRLYEESECDIIIEAALKKIDLSLTLDVLQKLKASPLGSDESHTPLLTLLTILNSCDALTRERCLRLLPHTGAHLICHAIKEDKEAGLSFLEDKAKILQECEINPADLIEDDTLDLNTFCSKIADFQNYLEMFSKQWDMSESTWKLKIDPGITINQNIRGSLWDAFFASAQRPITMCIAEKPEEGQLAVHGGKIILTTPDELGEGTFGVVYKAVVMTAENCTVAAAKFAKANTYFALNNEKAILDHIYKEQTVITGLQPAPLGFLYHSSYPDIACAIVSPLYSFTLKEVIRKVNWLGNEIILNIPETSRPKHYMHFSNQLAQGLAYLHQVEIAHRDIKPDNIFVVKDTNGIRVGLTDLGSAQKFHLSADQRRSQRGQTAFYLLEKDLKTMTEAFENGNTEEGIKYQKAMDIYALALTLFQLVTGGSIPFVKKPKQGSPDPANFYFNDSLVSTDYPETFVNLLRRSLSLNSDLRPSAEALKTALSTSTL